MEASRGFEGEPSKMSLCKSFIGQLGRGFLFIIISHHLNAHFFLFFFFCCLRPWTFKLNHRHHNISIRFPSGKESKKQNGCSLWNRTSLASAFVCSISLSNKALFVWTEYPQGSDITLAYGCLGWWWVREPLGEDEGWTSVLHLGGCVVDAHDGQQLHETITHAVG